ncbi:Alkaline protease secretion ATP-binding protein AprD [Rubrivivax sp. A210]|uniref:type I secretion system permease/ATPase n=1 Tax=Rubrivivax sp. A210 TaxID=2772301 RepID=UPI001918A957|nr:type I secretion system permease/ATPase [Rubrivivax sp. A210]CAD5372615.1 Alkaline protease secretion ATP-binding protein AprD [Rubrivivax sp. A210]
MTQAAGPQPRRGANGTTAALAHLLRRPLAWVALLSVALNVLLLAPTLYMLQVFDRVIPAASGSTLAALLVGASMALLLGLALDVLRARLLGVSGRLAGAVLAPAVTRRLVVQVARPGGQADGQTLRDVAAVQTLFGTGGVAALFDTPWVLIYVGLIAAIDARMGVAAAVFALLMLALAGLSHGLLRRGAQDVQSRAGAATQHLQGAMRVAESLVAMGMVDAMLARWRGLSDAALQPQRALERRAALLAALARLLRQLVQVGMLAVGAWLVISGSGSAGLMIGATVLLGRALAPLEQVVSGWRTLSEGAASWQRLGQLLDGEAAPAAALSLPRPAGRLSAVGLSLRAPTGARMILDEVSLELAAGECLAIVGPSGAGKSSLLRVLAGIWAPDGGQVQLDGASLTQWPEGELGRWLGYLAQDIQLFDGSVADNIARLQVPEAASVIQAARRAGAHEAVLALPEGYDTRVGNGAVSPGQRQRIGLARALYGDPCLVLLDEPNANLDGSGEVSLGEALQALRGQVTVVVVTHRKNLLRLADKILVLEGGRVQHFGARDTVLQALIVPPPAADAGSARVTSLRRPATSPAPGARPR